MHTLKHSTMTWYVKIRQWFSFSVSKFQNPECHLLAKLEAVTLLFQLTHEL